MKQPNYKIEGYGCRRERARDSGAARKAPFLKTGILLRAKRIPALLLAITGLTAAWIRLGAQTASEPADKYLWLEDVSGERALAWVKAENERSAKVLEMDPRFRGLEATALKVLESPDRLPVPSLNERDVYNTWQDKEHVRGILRRTSLADYLTAQPHWRTVLDYDALAKQDNEKWVQKGLNCLYPGNDLCLVALSAGGEDAYTLREFNLKTGKFVAGGFVLPRSKQDVAWMDKDTLLVARDWGAGTMTKSGYPFVVKTWKRGQPLEQAKEVYRGAEGDESGTSAVMLNDGSGHHAAMLIRRISFFEQEVSLVTPDGAKRIALPGKTNVEGLLEAQIIVTLNEDWKLEGTDSGENTKFVQGSVISLDLEAVKKDPLHLKPRIVFAPTAVEFAQSVDTTKNHLLLTTLENVQGRAYVYSLGAKGVWTRKRLDVPDNRTIDIATTNWSDNEFFLSLTGFLTPSSLWLGDAGANTLEGSKDVAAAV